MQGGVVLFRGSGADARRYVESDRSRADDYYLGADASVAQFTALDGAGNVIASQEVGPEAYAPWVDWTHPVTGESMGRPRLAGDGRQGSPKFAEMVVNAPKSLSIAAALHTDVSQALDTAQRDAAQQIGRWLAEHSVTRVGKCGAQEVVPAAQLQTVAVAHRTSRAGDPHRHIHFQIGTRVWAAGKWRALDTGALFRQQGAIRALGTAVIAAHPGLADALDRHGLTLDPVSGEVVELERFNAVMSKRGEQVRRHLHRFEAEWDAAHPGEAIGPVVSARLAAKAWAFQRPAKKPTTLREEHAWVAELKDAGYDPAALPRPDRREPISLDDLSIQTVASRALDRCAAGGSTWTRHSVQEHATRIMTDYGVRATPNEIREFVTLATTLAIADCFSVLPLGAPAPEHVAHLTSVRVAQADMQLRDLLTARVDRCDGQTRDTSVMAGAHRLDPGQLRAAAAVASDDPLVVVEGAAGAGKTTMLGVAIEVAAGHGRSARVVAPTLRAAQVARDELGVPATSVAALVHAHGWRWDDDGVWTRLVPGDVDPETGHVYHGPSEAARLTRGERLIVDEAGMLDQDTAVALLAICDEAGAGVVLVGDRAQLAAVGRGGVLEIAAQIRGETIDMAEVHRFADPGYAGLTLRMRDRERPGDVFDELAAQGLIRLHDTQEKAWDYIAEHRRDGEAVTVTSNDEASAVNACVRIDRVRWGLVDDTRTVPGSDGQATGAGDLIQTRKNDATVGVANRQMWTVQRVEDDGALSVREAAASRKHLRTVRLPAEYVARYTHLSYAATAYGMQGATVRASHTLLTDSSSSAGIYVGMTRGRTRNLLHVVAGDMAAARKQFIEAMERDRADRGLTDASRHAAREVTGLIAGGPVAQVNEHIAGLLRQAAAADARAERWRQVQTALAELHTRDAAEIQAARGQTDAARRLVTTIRAEVAAPIASSAREALTGWRNAMIAEQVSNAKAIGGSWFARRRRRDEQAAATRASDALQQLMIRWGGPPALDERDDAWVERVTQAHLDADPRVIAAEQAVGQARETAHHELEQARAARLVAYARVFGTGPVSRNPYSYLAARPAEQIAKTTADATAAREEAALLRTLTPTEALARIGEARTEQSAREAMGSARTRAGLRETPRQRQRQPQDSARSI